MSVEPLDREFPCGIPPLVNIADGGHGPQTPTERYMVITTHWVGAVDGGTIIDWGYIACRQSMVTQYIVTCPIMDLCLAAERRLGMRLLWIW